MDNHATMQYMNELELALNKHKNIYTKPRSQRSIEVHYKNAELDAFGTIVVSRRNLSSHYSLKVTLYSYDGIKKCSQSLKDISLDDAVTAITKMVEGTAEIITNATKNNVIFKKIAIDEFGKMGFIAACESKYMLMLTAKNAKIIIAFTDDGTFRATYTKTHCKAIDKNQYETSGELVPDNAYQLVQCFATLQ